jgi:hypothetical protein
LDRKGILTDRKGFFMTGINIKLFVSDRVMKYFTGKVFLHQKLFFVKGIVRKGFWWSLESYLVFYEMIQMKVYPRNQIPMTKYDRKVIFSPKTEIKKKMFQRKCFVFKINNFFTRFISYKCYFLWHKQKLSWQVLT